MAATFEVEIADIGFGGDGVGRVNGKAVFVPFTIAGERVSARIAREKKQLIEADLVEVLEPSPHRVTPLCPYFGRCGGCAYQHISYAHQLTIKEEQVEQVLRRIGKLHDVPMQPIIASPNEYGYRNRITVHAHDGTVGFYRHDKQGLLDITSCPISRPEVNSELAQLRKRRLRDGNYTLRARESARVFEQTNDEVAAALRELVASFCPQHRPLLVDAFCGAGFFTKRLARQFDRVVGIEWDKRAVAVAAADAAPNESYIAGDVDVELPLLLEQNRSTSMTLIVDPPAIGLSERTRATLLHFTPDELIYVSCNPATLARDLGQLQSQFRIVSVTPLDMFPQTAEIEVAARLQRIGV